MSYIAKYEYINLQYTINLCHDMSHHVDFKTLAKSVSKTLHLSYTLQLFVTTATTFSTVLYMARIFTTMFLR